MLRNAHADITSGTFDVSDTFGDLDSVGSIFVFFYNLFVYLGWALVLIGIAVSLVIAIFNFAKSDSSETMENLKASLTKVVFIVIIGLLILSGAFIVNFIAGLFGITMELKIPSELFVK